MCSIVKLSGENSSGHRQYSQRFLALLVTVRHIAADTLSDSNGME
ncbi:hypothetical protein [Nostoc mirabile]|nr:hypothetical protein [Nostoc mirabile]